MRYKFLSRFFKYLSKFIGACGSFRKNDSAGKSERGKEVVDKLADTYRISIGAVQHVNKFLHCAAVGGNIADALWFSVFGIFNIAGRIFVPL